MFSFSTTLTWNELLAAAVAIGLTLYVVIGLMIVTNPNRRKP